MLDSVLTETVNAGITMGQFLLCTVTSVLLGAVLAVVHTYRNRYSRSFILTLVLLPVTIQTRDHAGKRKPGYQVAVIGAFSLVQFQVLAPAMQERLKYIPGHGSGSVLEWEVSGNRYAFDDCVWRNYHPFDILPAGRAGSKGYASFDYHQSGFRPSKLVKLDILLNGELVRVRTVNMGSLYELCYQVDLKSEFIEKNMLDEIRCRNGNLTIVCGRLPDGRDEL